MAACRKSACLMTRSSVTWELRPHPPVDNTPNVGPTLGPPRLSTSFCKIGFLNLKDKKVQSHEILYIRMKNPWHGVCRVLSWKI